MKPLAYLIAIGLVSCITYFTSPTANGGEGVTTITTSPQPPSEPVQEPTEVVEPTPIETPEPLITPLPEETSSCSS